MFSVTSLLSTADNEGVPAFCGSDNSSCVAGYVHRYNPNEQESWSGSDKTEKEVGKQNQDF